MATLLSSKTIPKGPPGNTVGTTGATGATGPAAGGSFNPPSGLIVFWSGTLANIPSGWYLCDGTNGTPDLRNKFAKGAAAGQNPGSTGGAATHTHADHSSRTHSGAAISDHAAMSHSGMAVGDHTSGAIAGPVASSYASTGTTHSVTQPSDHAAQSHSVTQPSAHSARTHSTDNSEPVYFKLAYIMKG